MEKKLHIEVPSNNKVVESTMYLGSIDGKGSVTLKWHVASTIDTIEECRKRQIKFVEKMKPKRLKELEAKKEAIRQSSKDKNEFAEKMEQWEEAEDYFFELQKFETSLELEEWGNADSEITLKKVELKACDLKGIELNSTTYKALKLIAANFDDLLEELKKYEASKAKEDAKKEGKPPKK